MDIFHSIYSWFDVTKTNNLPIGAGDAYTTFCTAGTICFTIGAACTTGAAWTACAWTVGALLETTALKPI